MADLPDRGIWGSLRGCSGWISCMLCGIRCSSKDGRSGRWRESSASLGRPSGNIGPGGAGAEGGGCASAAAGVGCDRRAGAGGAG